MHKLIPDNFNFSPSGPLNPLFLYADNVRLNEIQSNPPLSASERDRLVKAAKSPTVEELLETAYKKTQFMHSSMVAKYCEPSPERTVIQEYEHPRTKTPIDAPACKTIIEFRDWQETWRVRTEADCISGSLPPAQSGQRESSMLTARGATKIAEACEYIHLQKGGFKTFVTGTFNAVTRQRIENGDTTIQKEVTRTMDALQKMYQRGWTTEQGERIAGNSDGLPYLWVVEIPDNKDGEPNPHIHMLLGWQVEYTYFKNWAKRIEDIWGNGYFHLEKIKDSACAGAYMAKAAGYLCKAQDKDDQGTVQGNRYGISKTARAPAWVEICHAQMHTMGQLIYDIYDHLTVKYGDKYRERKTLNTALANTPKSEKGKRKKIGARLAKVRQELNAIPIRCNKYQVVIKGKGAALAFFSWLKIPTSQGAIREEWLPEKPEGWHWEEGPKPEAKNNKYFYRLYQKFKQSRFWRRLANIPAWIEEAAGNAFWHCVKKDYDAEIDYNRNSHKPTYDDLAAFGYA